MFYLCIAPDTVTVDTLPVAETIYYPWAIDSYNPMAFARCAWIESEGLLLNLQAFERYPASSEKLDLDNNSCVAVSFSFTKNSNGVLTAVFNANGQYQIFINAEPVELPLDIYTDVGLLPKGHYWSVQTCIPRSFLQQHFPVSNLKNGHKMKGNIYKFLRTGEKSHLGSAAPMQQESIFAFENLGDWLAVNY